MPKLIATHEVDDVAHWLASPKRVEVFGSAVSVSLLLEGELDERSRDTIEVADWVQRR